MISKNYGNSTESDTFNEDFMVKLLWRLPGNLIYETNDIIFKCMARAYLKCVNLTETDS